MSDEMIKQEMPQDAKPTVRAAAVPEVGQRLRLMRQRRKWTLSDLSERTNTSVGMLSQIERGLSSPSIRTLQRLADTFAVPIGWFFSDSPTPPPNTPSWLLRPASRRVLSLAGQGITKELLSPPGEGALELLIITIQPGGSTGQAPYTHAGEDAGTILEGTLKLEVAGESALLQPGDAFRFASTLPHRFENPGTVPCVALWVITPPLY
ncbi:XRE family transcriptional regulator [Hyphomicrobium sp. CS1BSMeth3]|uniref:helix-turn-helix domain-containing protein n=1 Tax=Hyphomicrobium sp. CS1BSMeth3 TaxID=1892844 RepID=UPI0009F84F2A|nr:XRE family transcriptional regulator [Hyphomicrobium sp. CS1BSMeth3]MBN9264857.1 helix-turn-helix transcriptional regulator [Hyphomicrobium sp.]